MMNRLNSSGGMKFSRCIICFQILIALLWCDSFCQSGANETVVLLHGLGRSSSSMKKLEKSLQAKGYSTINLSYPSRRVPIKDIVDSILLPKLEEVPSETEKIHFVTHSMGGIVVRYMLAYYHIEKLGRVVMLGPPNGGSEVADFLHDKPPVSTVLGKNLADLQTDSSSLVNVLPALSCEVGVIAGTRSINWINSLIIPGKDDGKVSVENTRLEGMTDHIVLPVTHTFMMKNRKVIDQVIIFLSSGHFSGSRKTH